MGLTESSLNTIIKPFSFLSHCKVHCYSPCCQSLCGDDNHCNCEVNTIEDTDDKSVTTYSSPRTLTPR